MALMILVAIALDRGINHAVAHLNAQLAIRVLPTKVNALTDCILLCGTVETVLIDYAYAHQTI